MIDDAYGFFGETETVGLTAPEITALDGVLHEAGETVVVHFSSASSVDASLRGDTVCTAGCIVEGEGLDVVAQFTEGGGAGRAGESGTDDDDRELAPVEWADELVVEFASGPGRRRIAGRDLTVHRCPDAAQIVEFEAVHL